MKGAIIVFIIAMSIFFYYAWANAESTEKRTFNWDNAETCVERCYTDPFGNESCYTFCY